MSNMDINQVLAQMRVLEARAQSSSEIQPAVTEGKAAEKVDFAELLQDSINSVNDTQQAAGKLATAFEKGDPNVSLAETVVALEKASVSFEAVKQVRNRLLTAYQEVMKMSI